MPYMELRDYSKTRGGISLEQRDSIMDSVRRVVTQGGEIDGTYEFRYARHDNELDYCEHDYILVIDMGWSQDRDDRLIELGENIGSELEPILRTTSLAVRPRLQRAAFVPFRQR